MPLRGLGNSKKKGSFTFDRRKILMLSSGCISLILTAFMFGISRVDCGYGDRPGQLRKAFFGSYGHNGIVENEDFLFT